LAQPLATQGPQSPGDFSPTPAQNSPASIILTPVPMRTRQPHLNASAHALTQRTSMWSKRTCRTGVISVPTNIPCSNKHCSTWNIGDRHGAGRRRGETIRQGAHDDEGEEFPLRFCKKTGYGDGDEWLASLIQKGVWLGFCCKLRGFVVEFQNCCVGRCGQVVDKSGRWCFVMVLRGRMVSQVQLVKSRVGFSGGQLCKLFIY